MNMITAMLVDDDQLVLDDLQTIIDWKHLGFRIIATATNGKKALSLYNKFHPQLVITDIVMPFITGLELAATIHLDNPDVELLIVTSYDEFEYAKKALQSGVADYILKTEMNPLSLTQRLIDIQMKLNNEVSSQQHTLRLELQDYLKSDVPDEKYFQENPILESGVRQLSSILSKKYHFFLISKVQSLEKAHYSPYDSAKNEEGKELYLLLKEMDMTSFQTLIIFHVQNIVVLGIPLKVNREMRSSTIQHTCKRIMDFLYTAGKDCLYVMFYHTERFKITEFKNYYKNLEPLIHFFTFFQDRSIINLADLETKQVLRTNKSFPYETLPGYMNHEDKIQELFQEHLNLLFENHDLYGLNHFYINICFHFEHIASHSFQMDNACQITNQEQYFNWLMNSYYRCLDSIQQNTTITYTKVTQDAISYIKKHYGEFDLSLDTIAEYVELSTGRLSVLFKKNTGMTINEYIISTRIKEAIYLLENTNYKIYEITEKVGYKSSQYFSQIFAQKTNRRPIDFRKTPPGSEVIQGGVTP